MEQFPRKYYTIFEGSERIKLFTSISINMLFKMYERHFRHAVRNWNADVSSMMRVYDADFWMITDGLEYFRLSLCLRC
jgi:hypothetical protein